MAARCVGVRKSALALTMFEWLRLRSELHHSSALASACYHKGAAICHIDQARERVQGESTGMQGWYLAVVPPTVMGPG